MGKDWEDGFYGVGVREPTAGELEFFKSTRGQITPAYAADDDRIVVNPFFKFANTGEGLTPEQLYGIKLNEASRIHMRRGHIVPPRYDVSEEQLNAEIAPGFPLRNYSQDMNDIRQTIAARILSGDVGQINPTPEQVEYAAQLRKYMGVK